MTHIELLNEDVQLATTFTMTACCDACDANGGGGCSCDTYVCGVGNVSCSTCNVCNACNITCEGNCYTVNY